MDTTVQPWLSMGVRPPYTQTFINEDASWSDDGTVYTAYLTLTAQKGDANGSMDITVADVVTEIAYLTNQNPQPFIFEPAATTGLYDLQGRKIMNGKALRGIYILGNRKVVR